MPKFGRSPSDMRVLPGVTVLVGETAEEAEAMFQGLEELVPPCVGVEYLGKMMGMNLNVLPLDGPVPTLDGEKVGGTGIARRIAKMAAEEGPTIR